MSTRRHVAYTDFSPDAGPRSQQGIPNPDHPRARGIVPNIITSASHTAIHKLRTHKKLSTSRQSTDPHPVIYRYPSCKTTIHIYILLLNNEPLQTIDRARTTTLAASSTIYQSAKHIQSETRPVNTMARQGPAVLCAVFLMLSMGCAIAGSRASSWDRRYRDMPDDGIGFVQLARTMSRHTTTSRPRTTARTSATICPMTALP